MSHALISRSADLQRLVNEGYELELRSDHLLIHGIPYVTAERTVAEGVLVSKLTVAGDVAHYSGDHVAYFIGGHPCNRDGSSITGILHQANPQTLAEGLIVDRSFSNKPQGGYSNYFDKMDTYIRIVSSPAASLVPGSTAQKFRPLLVPAEFSVFQYMDTASTRAGIRAISERLARERIAIVGVGGTGSYVLDLVAKCPAHEIHLFDGGHFVNHNAFRAPGAPTIEELRSGTNKALYFGQIYGRMRRNVFAHATHITEANVGDLDQCSFVFVCIDVPSSKRPIFDYLRAKRIPFVDVGMGIEVLDDSLRGVLRVTACTPDKHDHLSRRVSTQDVDGDEYASNIQIAELNAMNAALAVIRWKKMAGFYSDLEREHESSYSIDVNMLTSDECADAHRAS